MNFSYRKLLGRIRELDMNQQDVADALGITRTALNNKLRNKTQFSQPQIVDLCKVLDIDVTEIGAYFFTQVVA